jgi:hypothetical protein
MRSVRTGGRKLRTAAHRGKWASAANLHARLSLGEANRVEIVGGVSQYAAARSDRG